MSKFRPIKFIKKCIKPLICLAAAGIILFVGINAFVIIYSSQYIISADEAAKLDADCVIAPGALVYNVDSLSPILEDRTQTAIDLYDAKAAKKLLFSGDHGRVDYDEVNAMKKFANNEGISNEDIFLDHAGFSTYETMYRAKNIFCAKKVIISTQKFHLARSIFLARAMGMDAYGVVCDKSDYGRGFQDGFRESFARVKDFFTAIFKPAPTYGGDEIPVSGSGTLTQDK